MLNKCFLFLLFCSGVFFYACSEEPSIDLFTQLNIRLTDGPDDYEAVNIDLQMVTIKSETGGFDSIALGTSAGIYNLLDYQNGLDTLIADGVVDIDTLKEVRLILGDDNTIQIDSVLYDLKTPSAQQSGLKIKLNADLTTTDIYDLILDFDVEESIIEQGNGDYLLKPVIKVVQ